MKVARAFMNEWRRAIKTHAIVVVDIIS